MEFSESLGVVYTDKEVANRIMVTSVVCINFTLCKFWLLIAERGLLWGHCIYIILLLNIVRGTVNTLTRDVSNTIIIDFSLIDGNDKSYLEDEIRQM